MRFNDGMIENYMEFGSTRNGARQQQALGGMEELSAEAGLALALRDTFVCASSMTCICQKKSAVYSIFFTPYLNRVLTTSIVYCPYTGCGPNKHPQSWKATQVNSGAIPIERAEARSSSSVG